MIRSQSARRSAVLSLAVFLVALLVIPSPSDCAVRDVTLFPSSAKINDTLAVGRKSTAVIVLPPQADPESLSISLSAGKIRIDDIAIRRVAHADEAKIAQLRAHIKKLQNDKKELQARIHAIDAQIQFWQAQTKTKTKNVTEADHLSTAIGRNIRRLHSEKNTVESEYPRLDKHIKELEEALNQAAGKKENAWEATVTLSQTGASDVLLHYSYLANGCGWKPFYRLEADVTSRTVFFSWDAEVWQSTGEDWKNAQIHLATVQPPKTLTPPELRPWIIKPIPAIRYQSSRKAKAPSMADLQSAEPEDALPQAAPVETARVTYSVWSLGPKTINAGSRQRFKIREEAWPAEFRFLARPSLSPEAFVRAQIKMTKTMDIPPGQAIFAIDGAVIGKREFAFRGTEADIFFGNSPFITVTSTSIDDKTGSSVFLKNKQTRRWHWRMEAVNTGRVPATLRIEEPVPQPRDERIRMNVQHRPEPAEKDPFLWIWIVDLPALQKKSIDTVVEMEAPAEMVLDFGLRR